MSQQRSFIKPVSVDGTYVKTHDGKSLLTPRGILKSSDIAQSKVRVKVSSDRDISASLDGRTGYIKEVYLKFENGEISTSIAVEGCVLEYRSNVGADKTFHRGQRKWEGVYLKSYACVGFPVPVVDSIIDRINAENPGLDWDNGESIRTERDGYYWPTVKLPVDQTKTEGFPCLVVDSGRLIHFSPIALMSKNHKSLVGVGMFSFRLKKVGDNPKACRGKRYTLGITMTSFQVTHESNQRGPGISENMPTVGFKDYGATSELVDAINELLREDEAEAEGSEEESDAEEEASPTV